MTIIFEPPIKCSSIRNEKKCSTMTSTLIQLENYTTKIYPWENLKVCSNYYHFLELIIFFPFRKKSVNCLPRRIFTNVHVIIFIDLFTMQLFVRVPTVSIFNFTGTNEKCNDGDSDLVSFKVSDWFQYWLSWIDFIIFICY